MANVRSPSPHHCGECGLPQLACICEELDPVDSQPPVTIIRHTSEVHRSSNSGRLAHLTLRNSELIDYDGRTQPSFPTGSYLVYPTGTPLQPNQPPPSRLIVLDASWSQTRRMWRKLDGLRGMPTLALPEQHATPARLRKSPHPGWISTIEAIAAALALCGDHIAAARCSATFAHAVARMRAIGRNGIPLE